MTKNWVEAHWILYMRRDAAEMLQLDKETSE